MRVVLEMRDKTRLAASLQYGAHVREAAMLLEASWNLAESALSVRSGPASSAFEYG